MTKRFAEARHFSPKNAIYVSPRNAICVENTSISEKRLTLPAAMLAILQLSFKKKGK